MQESVRKGVDKALGLIRGYARQAAEFLGVEAAVVEGPIDRVTAAASQSGDFVDAIGQSLLRVLFQGIASIKRCEAISSLRARRNELNFFP